MDIYSSTKAAPYVYICTHKETNQFYIGYRMANVKLNRPSHLDLPEYKTSSTTIRPDFHDYTWTIVAEFFDPSHAYTFEQQMIFDNWKNPLLLNEHYNLGKNQFRVSGPNGKKGKPNGRKGISTGPSPLKGRRNGKQQNPRSVAHCKNLSEANINSAAAAKHRKNLSEAKLGKTSPKKGKPSGRKGIPSPLKGKPNGRKGISTGPNGRKGKPTGKPAWNKGIPSGQKGIPKSDEAKQNMRKPQKLVECPHCGLIGGISNMKRKHFDNCKKRPVTQGIEGVVSTTTSS